VGPIGRTVTGIRHSDGSYLKYYTPGERLFTSLCDVMRIIYTTY
jgi:hypothetical protein